MNVTTPVGSGVCRPVRHCSCEVGPGAPCGLEILQLGARFDAELVVEVTPQPLERAQRVGLSPVAVQRGHQQRPQAFAQRVLGHRGLGGRTTPRYSPSASCAFEQSLDGDEAQLVEPRGLRGRPRRALRVGERRAAPQRQRVAEHRSGAASASPLAKRARPIGNAASNRAASSSSCVDDDAVAARPGDDPVAAQRLAQLRDVRLQGLRRGAGWLHRPRDRRSAARRGRAGWRRRAGGRAGRGAWPRRAPPPAHRSAP